MLDWHLLCCLCDTNYFQFFILAFAVGMVMGGIQSLSRSTYSKLLPHLLNDTASYFSFFDVCDKLGIVIGTLSFGMISLDDGWYAKLPP
jgi:UMF1 family MFS transporter